VIAVSHLRRTFDDRVAVDDVTFDVRASEIVALLGPNGAGKTTTMRMMAGLIAPTSGAVTLDGAPLARDTAGRLRTRIGFLTEAPGLWDRLTVRENLAVYARIYGLPRPDEAIAHALDAFTLADRGSTRAAELSKGMRQKVALARALLHGPDVLLLDEPTVGLDPEITRGVRLLLEERRAAGCAVLVSTHNLAEAERLADRIAIIRTRLVALDTPANLRRRARAGRTVIRVRGQASALVALARAGDPDAVADGDRLELALGRPEDETPAIIRALVGAGADVVEVRQEAPSLEEVYLRLVGAAPGPAA
jgi:ABC-2 type transport system ATP-binding protein